MSVTNNRDVCTEFFNKIYDESFPKLRKFVAIKCSDPVYLQDILQEIYLDYYRLLLRKGVGYAGNNCAVLFKIAKRRIYRYYSLKEKMKLFIPLNSDKRDAQADNLPDPTSLPEETDASMMISSRRVEISATEFSFAFDKAGVLSEKKNSATS